MDRDDLQKNVRILATMKETEMPVVSCYLNTEQGYPSCQAFLAERTILLKRIIPPEQRDSLDHSLERIESYVHENAYARDVRGIAVFVRTVENPFLLGLRFHVPLPNLLLVDSVPNIFHLVELKETYDRYVVVLMTGKRAAILEINLGTVTRQTWSEHPALPERVSREWTKEQYQRHRRKQTEEAIREKIMCSCWQKGMPPDQHGGVHVARRFKSVKANRMPVQNARRHSFEKLMSRRKC